MKKNGAAVNDNTCGMTFSLWDSQSNLTGQIGGTQGPSPVAVANGLFTVVLNDAGQFGASAFNGDARWLQTSVQCAGDGSPVTLSRQPLTAAPYALFSAAPWVTNGSNIFYTNGNVGIGTTAPTTKLTVAGQISTTGGVQFPDGTLQTTAATKPAPPCFDNANRYVDCGNGTVNDTVTGLIWLKNASCFGTENYATANNAAAGMKSGDCGLSDNSQPGDWRLPTKDEWTATVARAVALTCANPSLTNTAATGCFSAGPQPFTDVQSGAHWSRTPDLSGASFAWDVYLSNGYVGDDLKSNANYVWPVRGGH